MGDFLVYRVVFGVYCLVFLTGSFEMKRQYRRFVLQIYRRLRHPRRLKQSRVLRWFGGHFMDKRVWRPTRHTLGLGLAVGLAVSMVWIPGQVPIAAFLCGWLRVNIPIAVMACWISNPVTFAPIAWWEIKLGNALMTMLNIGEPVSLGWSELTALAREADTLLGFFASVKPWAFSLYLGGVVGGLALAPVGYLAVYALWDLTLMLSHRRKKPVKEGGI